MMVFHGAQYLLLLEQATNNKVVFYEHDTRNPNRRKLTNKNIVMLYGQRPMNVSELRYMSPYEFTMYFEPILLRYPLSIEEDESGHCHAKLTTTGKQKLEKQENCDLVPGTDYIVKEEGGKDWFALNEAPGITTFKHEWILKRRQRPVAPHFKGCPSPRHKPGSAERNAKIIMTYFHPWTLREDS